MIEIVAARADWPDEFAALKARLLPIVPGALAIHHIGSTAVPGLVAKDVIDIQITVDDLSDVDEDAFISAGFKPRHGLADHAPAGLVLAPEELTKRFFKQTTRLVNVHVREVGRFNQRYALLFRDFLRAHPVAATAYGLIKQRLAARFMGDVEAYYDIKDPLFDIVMDGAEEWAARIGWQAPPGD